MQTQHSQLSLLPKSSVAQKFLMAASGLFLCLFLIVHLAGNLFLLASDGGASFNAYATYMSTNTAIQALEWVLAAGFIAHIVFGLYLAHMATRARPTPYAVSPGSDTASPSSRFMWLSGAFVLFFLVVHLKTFWFHMRFEESPLSPYHLVKTTYESIPYTLFYVLSLAVLGWHLRHGFQSAFQSMGMRHRVVTPWIQRSSVLFWGVIPFLFAIIPLYFLLTHLLE